MKTKKEWTDFLDANDETWEWISTSGITGGIMITSAEGLGDDYAPVVMFDDDGKFTGFTVVV